jgi:hypothetical protein
MIVAAEELSPVDASEARLPRAAKVLAGISDKSWPMAPGRALMTAKVLELPVDAGWSSHEGAEDFLEGVEGADAPKDMRPPRVIRD